MWASTSVECRILSCFSLTAVFLQVCSFLEWEILSSVSQLTVLRIIIYSSPLILHGPLIHGQSTITSFPKPFPSSFSLLQPHCDNFSLAHKISLNVIKCFFLNSCLCFSHFAIWLSLFFQDSDEDELYPSQPGSGNRVSQPQLTQKLKKAIFTSCCSHSANVTALEIVST